MTTNKDNENIQ